MDVVAVILTIFIIILISTWLFQQWKDRKKSLPGPRGFPILGYLPFMTKKPYVVFKKLSEIYGSVYQVQLGGRKLVVLCDFQSMKDAFNDDAFMGRPDDLPFDFSETTIKTGAVLELPWKEQRKFCLHAFRDLGYGKSKMEEHIQEEIIEFIQRLINENGKPLQISDFLTPSTSNNIASLLFGKRLKYDDPDRQFLDQLIKDIGLRAAAIGWQIFFPWIGALMRRLNVGGNSKLSKTLVDLKSYLRKELEEHEATLDPNNIRDFMDRYILEIQKNSNDSNSTFQKDVLVDVAMGFFQAGSETVRGTVDWLLLVVAGYPTIQQKIHREIDDVLGRDRFPNYQDHLEMPYTEAVIMELYRWVTLVPINFMRRTLKDTELNGYFIPKNSDVLSILYCLDHDEKLWGNDESEFKPERFLSENGKRVVKPDYFIPFSIGKRSCPGKTLGEIEVFLYFTAIMQKFKIAMPPGKKPNFEAKLGSTSQPERQGVCLELL